MKPLGDKGFTIVTVIIGGFLSLVVAGAFASFHQVQLTTMRNDTRRARLQTRARNVLDLLTTEIRQAGVNPTCAAGINPIVGAKQHLLRIQADHNEDGVISGDGEDITYQYKASLKNLKRTSGGVTDLMIEGMDLSGSTLAYFDGNGTEITAGSTGLSAAQRDNVRRIRIELVITDTTAHPLPVTISAASNIDIRNRYFVNAVDCT